MKLKRGGNVGTFYIEVLCADGVWRRERRLGFIDGLVEAISVVESYTDYGRIKLVGLGLARDDVIVWTGKLAALGRQ